MRRICRLGLMLSVLSVARPTLAEGGILHESSDSLPVPLLAAWAETSDLFSPVKNGAELSAPPGPTGWLTSEARAPSCAEGCVDSSAECFAPNMIGNGGLGMPRVFRPIGGGPFVFIHRQFSKISDNNSAVPRDRVFYSFRFYGNTPLIDTLGMGHNNFGMYSHRFGIEKTFLDGNASAELILPFQYSTRSDISGKPFTKAGMTNTELGQLAFGGKYVLHRSESSVVSVGLRVETPTDRHIQSGPLVHDTNAFYFTPYVAFLRTNGDCFFQGFASHRIRSRDMDREIVGSSRGGVRDPNLLMADAALGYWAYRNADGHRLTGIAPTVEIHYQSQSEAEAQRLFQDALYGEHIDSLTLTAGVTAMFGENLTASVAWVLPLRTGNFRGTAGPLAGLSQPTDRFYEHQIAFQVNYFLGN